MWVWCNKYRLTKRKEECFLAGIGPEVKGGIRIPNSRQNQFEQKRLLEPPPTKPKLFTPVTTESSTSSSSSSFLSVNEFRREFDECLKNAISRWKDERKRIAIQKNYTKMEREMLDQSLLQVMMITCKLIRYFCPMIYIDHGATTPFFL